MLTTQTFLNISFELCDKTSVYSNSYTFNKLQSSVSSLAFRRGKKEKKEMLRYKDDTVNFIICLNSMLFLML